MRQDEAVSFNPVSMVTQAQAVSDVRTEPTGTDESVSSQLATGAAVQSPGSIAKPVVLLDEVALEVARAAAVGEAGNPARIGEFLVAVAEDELAVSVTFAADQPGYRGWHWSVTLALLAEHHPTVSEVVLLPGDGALLAPAWIPWDERIRPGDVGVGDLLPPIANDPRLVPAYLQSDDPAIEAVAKELGLGRVRVLSREGRVDFAERLHDGSFGPTDEMAVAAPATCVTCAFYLPLAGSLGQLVGACGNDLSPADGRVVDAGYGCGAHSETVLVMPARSAAGDTVIDELSLEVHRRPAPASGSAAGALDDDSCAEFDAADPGRFDELSDVVEIESLLGDPLDDDGADSDHIGAPLAEEELAEVSLLEEESAASTPFAVEPVRLEEVSDREGTEPGAQD